MFVKTPEFLLKLGPFTAGQEHCIQSFTLLAKRDLQKYGQLELWSSPKQEPTSNSNTSTSHGFKNARFTKPTFSSTLTRPNQKLDFVRPSFTDIHVEDHLAPNHDYEYPT